ncbi:Tim44 domain-containing protein [Achromobacter denitrificans]|jgi:predicted lipid-binding transport protein (Tim44 family)|uniref:TIM44-like domain-containing protein n=8 Tax=Achromobacter denitrificans TaxID=32002 RepID=A0A6J5I3U1_ACHDE|nr:MULTISPECIES: TIM44-like domain-containing protein [Achromobacter]ASC64238.1 transporter [Achromobacter denitrificans]MBV2157807.1 39S ribosomal protein L45 [Achromobacter denitrificans]OLU06371.1 transporter [Achromobacter denitrificans]QCS62599.1 Tim44 domain-containing protein [Achromobacter denitrificans]QKH44653.1 Tim44 domain-containing protein [Achromobacter denitrificans]
MSKFCLSRFVAAALIAVSGAALVTASFDAEARRAGGGSSVGRQSSNVTQQRQATTPPAAANNTAGATAAPAAAGAATAGAAGAAAKSGASRWLGPIAGIAAGLGIAALLSSMGLSGAFAEFLSSALLIGLVVFAIMFIVRRLRGAGPRTATQGAFGGANNASAGQQQKPMWRESLQPAAAPAAAPVAAAAEPAVLPKAGEDNNWFVPGDFDTPNFLKQAKDQFVRIQAIWDSGSTDRLREFLTDDLITELKPQLAERGAAPNKTEVVLLNAELLGIETVSDGHLASVRFSGMLREAPGTEAFRFEEVWNLFKPASGGWLLAGIQQIPVDYAS